VSRTHKAYCEKLCYVNTNLSTLNLSGITSMFRIVAMTVIVDSRKVLHTCCVGMFIIHLCTKFHIRSFSTFVITMKPRANENVIVHHVFTFYKKRINKGLCCEVHYCT
jgi:hypothetical protein